MDIQPPIGGTEIPQEGKLYDLRRAIYETADAECDIEISFNPNAEGQQQNDCRDLIVRYALDPIVINGRAIAERLQLVTTHRSGLGLLVLMCGHEQPNLEKIVISRFRADSGILAEENELALSVEYLEKVFLKNTKAYKAVVYRSPSVTAQFWDGRAVDKQINDPVASTSNYWIKEFLLSDFKTTSAAGTRRFAMSLRKAISTTQDMPTKEEIVAASRLAANLEGRATSVANFCNMFALSPAACQSLRSQFSTQRLFDEQFTFSKNEFDKHLAYASIKLDNGGILTAPAEKFDEVFEQRKIANDTQEVEFKTSGHIVDHRIRSSK